MLYHRWETRTAFLSLFSMILLAIFFCALPLKKAQAGPYTDSAHGSSSSGVDRNDPALADNSQGNCAHCHEQHASVNGVEPTPLSDNNTASAFALFSGNFNVNTVTSPYQQDDNFCFYCHTNIASLQSGGIDNKDYAATFAGYTTNAPLGIFEAFNQYSYHNLNNIWDFTRNTFSGFFTSASNPCTACHNPHKARRNKAHVLDTTFSAISRPSDHSNLWGNDPGEKMAAASSNNYMAPYYYNSAISYEPGSSALHDGSLTPDYNAFCTDCHNSNNIIYSNTLGRNLLKIDWYTEGGDTVAAGDKHGKNAATGDSNRINPYGDDNRWVLSCLDCHEPHGSPSSFLIRREINGTILTETVHTAATSPTGTSNIELLCAKCHIDNWAIIHHQASDHDKLSCVSCHKDPMHPEHLQPCEYCHSHGGYVIDATNPSLIRRTF